jgi:hypothetical protein
MTDSKRLGNVAFRTLDTGTTWTGRGSRARASVPSVRYSVPAGTTADALPASALARQVLVMRRLIEDFGGEATASNLARRMVAPGDGPAADDVQFLADLRAALVGLEARGAVTLEDLDGQDVIARIAREGAAFAYEPPSI